MKLVFRLLLHKLGKLMIREENILSMRLRFNYIVHRDAKRFECFSSVVFIANLGNFCFKEADDAFVVV